MVDSTDLDRMDEAKDALHYAANLGEFPVVPVLVIANKQDLPHALHSEDIIRSLDLHKLPRPWHVIVRTPFNSSIPASAIVGQVVEAKF